MDLNIVHKKIPHVKYTHKYLLLTLTVHNKCKQIYNSNMNFYFKIFMIYSICKNIKIISNIDISIIYKIKIIVYNLIKKQFQ